MNVAATRLVAVAIAVIVPGTLAARFERASAPAGQDVARQDFPRPDSMLPIPFGVGERLIYDVRFGPVRVGHGSMEIIGIDTVRGRAAWHAHFRVKGGNFVYRVNDTYESWIDTERMHSLRYLQNISEGRYNKRRRYEFYPERQIYQENEKPEKPSIADPLDEASLLYFIRAVPLEVGRTYEFDRYFKPEKNPVRIKVLRRERVSVPAGTFQTIVIQPMIKSNKLFAENGSAEIWISEDSARMMVQMKSDLSFGSLNLYLRSVRRSTAAEDSVAVPADTAASPGAPALR